jgi:hypothetical protein
MQKMLSVLPIVLFACSTPVEGVQNDWQSIDDVPEQAVEVQQRTVLLDETPGLVELQVGTDQIVVNTDGTAALEVDVGSVVVGKLGGGYLRYVTDVIEQGDRIVLLTDRADLSDAILHGNYLASAEILERAATTWDLGNRVIYSGDVWSSEAGDFVTVEAFIADGAQVTLDPNFDFDIELFNGNWIDAGFTADVMLDYDADFVVNVLGAYDGTFEGQVLSRDIPFVFELGPVPVIGVATVDITAGVQGDFEAAGTSTLHTEADVTANLAAGYDDDGWYFDRDGSMTGDISFDNDIHHSVSTRAWLRAELTVELYGAAGAELTIDPWLELNSCPSDVPDAIPGVDVDAGLQGTHRYYFEALGWFDFDSGVREFDFGPWDVYSLQCEDGF